MSSMRSTASRGAAGRGLLRPSSYSSGTICGPPWRSLVPLERYLTFSGWQDVRTAVRSMLECAACKAQVPEGADRCPRCGGGRLLAPPSLLQRRGVLVAVYGAGAVLGGAWLAAAFGIQFLAFGDRALAALGR